MKLSEKEVNNLINFVKSEPRTVQEISHFIKRSWVTTEKYLQEISKKTDCIKLKVFRKGSQGALKVVYYENVDNTMADEVRENLSIKIKAGQNKQDFNFLDIYSHVQEKSKRSFIDKYEKYNELWDQVKESVVIFSGNLSFINRTEKGRKVINEIENLLKRKVLIKIICRINVGSLKNVDKISKLLIKYPGLIEIKHCYQPLRGIIVDDNIAKFANEELSEDYKKGEIDKNIKIHYEVYDEEWVAWLKKVFWSFYRTSLDYSIMLKEVKKIIS